MPSRHHNPKASSSHQHYRSNSDNDIIQRHPNNIRERIASFEASSTRSHHPHHRMKNLPPPPPPRIPHSSSAPSSNRQHQSYHNESRPSMRSNRIFSSSSASSSSNGRYFLQYKDDGRDEYRDHRHRRSASGSISKLFTWIWCLLCALGFLILLILLSILIRPFSSKLYKKYSNYAFSTFLNANSFLSPNRILTLTPDSNYIHCMEWSILLCRFPITNLWDMLCFLQCMGMNGSMKLVLTKNVKRKCGNVSCLILKWFLDFPMEDDDDDDGMTFLSSHHVDALDGTTTATTNIAPIQYLLFPGEEEDATSRAAMAAATAQGTMLKWNQSQELKQNVMLLPLLRSGAAVAFDELLHQLKTLDPVVFDVTMAHHYNHNQTSTTHPLLPPIDRRDEPMSSSTGQINLRIKRHVIDSNKTPTIWSFLDASTAQFSKQDTNARNQHQPIRSNSKTFQTKYSNIESSLVSIILLSILPFTWIVFVPLIFLAFWIWSSLKLYRWICVMEDDHHHPTTEAGESSGAAVNGGGYYNSGCNSGEQTPFCPTTPFVSPLMTATGWNDRGEKMD